MNNLAFENIYAGLFIKSWKDMSVEDRKTILENAGYQSYVNKNKNSLSVITFCVMIAAYFTLFALIPLLYWKTYLLVPVSICLTILLSLPTYSLINFMIVKPEVLDALRTHENHQQTND
jgi:hypothetical protein